MNLDQLVRAVKSVYPTYPIAEAVNYILGFYTGPNSTVPPNREFNGALNMLCKAPYSILELEWQFADEDDESWVLTEEEATELFRTGEFSHPETGEPQVNPESRVFRNYITTDLFDRICEGP